MYIFKIERFFKFERRLGSKNIIVDDQENMTLFQLSSCRLGYSNDIATGDCDTKESDELDKVNNNTNDDIKVNGKVEEHPIWKWWQHHGYSYSIRYLIL